MMCWMNFWTGSFLSVYMFGITNVGFELISFFTAHPKSLLDVIVFCLSGALGQLFIFLTINMFGALTLTLVTTTRKFFSILISSVSREGSFNGTKKEVKEEEEEEEKILQSLRHPFELTFHWLLFCSYLLPFAAGRPGKHSGWSAMGGGWTSLPRTAMEHADQECLESQNKVKSKSNELSYFQKLICSILLKYKHIYQQQYQYFRTSR